MAARTGVTLTIFTMVGITLMDIVTKNGTLLVDFTNALRRTASATTTT